MGISVLTCAVSILVAAASYIFLSIYTSLPKHDLRPLNHHGPIIRGRITILNLDGLTLIRTVRLPVIKLWFPGLADLSIKNSTSELVFKELRVKDVQISAPDIGKESLVAEAVIDADVAGLISTYVTVDAHLFGLFKRQLRLKTSGHFSAKITSLAVRVPIRLGLNRTGQIGLSQHDFTVTSGAMQHASFQGHALPKFAANIPLPWIMQPVTRFVIAQSIKENDVSEQLGRAWVKVRTYLDTSPWQTISVAKRSEGLPFWDTCSSQLSQAIFAVLGETALTEIKLPDQSPKLYREGGKTAYLQSWNKLTSEVKLDIKDMYIKRLAFNKAAMDWNSPSLASYRVQAGTDTHVMACTLDGFTTLVSTAVRLYANTSKPLKLITGMDSFGDGGTARAIVRAVRFSLVFAVDISPEGIELRTLHVDEFDSVDVTIEGLKSKRDDLVNKVLKFIKGQIASVATASIKQLLEKEVKRSTAAIETLESSLLAQGVEIPGLFRSTVSLQDPTM